MGRTKDAVLPDPVAARASMWEWVLDRRKGITVRWTGVGLRYPRARQVWRRGGESFKSENVVIAFFSS